MALFKALALKNVKGKCPRAPGYVGFIVIVKSDISQSTELCPGSVLRGSICSSITLPENTLPSGEGFSKKKFALKRTELNLDLSGGVLTDV